MQPAVVMTSEKFLEFLLSSPKRPIPHSYQRDESQFKIHNCTIHAMVHVLDPVSPFVLEFLKAKERLTGLSPSGFDLEDLIEQAKNTCQQIISEFFTTSGATTKVGPIPLAMPDDKNLALLGEVLNPHLNPAPAPFSSVYAFYDPPEPHKNPPSLELMILAAEDSHKGRVMRNEEMEKLGLGTLRVLMDVQWFERSPQKLIRAHLGSGGIKADDRVDVDPGLLRQDSSDIEDEDLGSADKLNTWLEHQIKTSSSKADLKKDDSGLEVGSLTVADQQRKINSTNGASEKGEVIVTSSSSTLKGGNLQYNFHDGIPISIKPPGYARERLLRHTIASRLTGLPYVSHPIIVQILIESNATLPD